MATTRETTDTESGKPRSSADLEELLNSPAIQALVNESWEQVDRGECIRIPISEIKRRMRID